MLRQSVSAFLLLMLMFAAMAGKSFGACHAVGPSAAGNGSGSDWNNRMNRLPATLVRGDTYYLMDGNYGSYNLTTADSGTLTITLKKAQSYDFGRSADGCTNDISAGWNAATMGAGQATITSLTANLGVDYITVDGNGQATAPGCGAAPNTGKTASDCGMFLGPIAGSNGGAYIYAGSWNNGSTRNDNWIIRYIEGQGTGSTSRAGSGEDDITFRDGTTGTLMDHMYLHDSGCDFFKIPVSTGYTVQNSYFWKNDSSASCHGQMMEVEVSSSNVDWHNNVFRAIKAGSTAVFSAVTGAQVSTWNIYNNIFTEMDVSNGIFACINSGVKCTNVRLIGNTLVNSNSTAGGIIWNEGVGSSYTVQNNLAYSYSGLSALGDTAGGSSTLIQDHNTALNSGSPFGGTGAINVPSGAPNPFVNLQASDFRLASQNSDWESGAALAAPFNVDMFGNQRPGTDGVWNRGAVEFAGAKAQGPAAPSGLAASIH